MSENHKLDTDEQVFFYEQDFYVLSNFSAFSVAFNGIYFPTSEHAYHYQKFTHTKDDGVRNLILHAPSAHAAFKMAESRKSDVRPDWYEVRESIMEQILLAKVHQHEYVKRKLLATGNRELVEDSWRDSFWGWGADRKGQNRLGKLWMKIRENIR